VNPLPVARTAACAHHWIIESPKGATSLGRCKKCNAEKRFANWVEDYYTYGKRDLS